MSPMATSLLSPHSAPPVSNFDSVTAVGISKTSFLHCSKLYFASSAANTLATTARRWRFRSPMASAKDPLDRIPKQFRQENLKEGLIENYKNAPEFLHGLSPSELDMFIDGHNLAPRLSESGSEGNISASGNYMKRYGMRSVSSTANGGPSRYITNALRAKRRRSRSRRYKGKKLPSPPDEESTLLFDRIIYLAEPIFPEITELIVSQLMWLDNEDKTKPIYLYISSSGVQDEDGDLIGSETDAYAIADVMAACKSKIYTINLGTADGQAAMLLSLGAKGRRGILPHAFTTLYLPEVPGSSGRATDMWLMGEELEGNTAIFLELLSKGTGKPIQELRRDLTGIKTFNAQEAIDYGLADRIVGPAELGGGKVQKKVNPEVARRKAELAHLKAMTQAQN